VSSNNGGGAGSGNITVFENDTITLSASSFSLEENNIRVYPNPTDTVLNVASNEAIIQIRIFNVLGKEILKTTSKVIDVSQLNQGIYLIEIEEDNNQTIIKRFVKK
jgi:hypothetical protein